MKPVLVTALVAAGAGVGLRTASQKSALEVAGQFVDMNPVASAECTALLAARGGELGVAVEASGGGKYTVEVSAGEGGLEHEPLRVSAAHEPLRVSTC